MITPRACLRFLISRLWTLDSGRLYERLSETLESMARASGRIGGEEIEDRR